MTRPIVLALDIAKQRTGWAVGHAGMARPFWGTWSPPRDWDQKSSGGIMSHWRKFLMAKAAEHGVTYIAKERLFVDMKDFDYNGTVPMAQLHGHVEQLVDELGIRGGEVAIASWRAHFLGTARALPGLGKNQRTTWLKDQAMKRCTERNWYTTVHDEAEALGIMDFALACLDPDYDHHVGPLARRAELQMEVAKFRGGVSP